MFKRTRLTEELARLGRLGARNTPRSGSRVPRRRRGCYRVVRLLRARLERGHGLARRGVLNLPLVLGGVPSAMSAAVRDAGAAGGGGAQVLVSELTPSPSEWLSESKPRCPRL